jgi:hypothetical protein
MSLPALMSLLPVMSRALMSALVALEPALGSESRRARLALIATPSANR